MFDNIPVENRMTKVTRTSQLTGKVHTMDIPVTLAELDAYYEGNRAIQDALPNLSAEHREFIMTGIAPAEWAALFPKGDEE